MKGDVATQAHDDLMASMSTTPDHRYVMPGFRGFAGIISEEELVRLQASEHVEYIEQNVMVHSNDIVQQSNATWGLARISHAEPYQTNYLFDSSAGEGTCAYVIDTGIEIEHPEFGGRAFFLADFSGEDTMIDGMGHGTHVAGTIGSMTWGVAKKTTLLAVRVLDSFGSGTTDGVIAGMEYVVTEAARSREAGECPNGFVANMSLGGRKTQAINDAAAAIVAAGIFLGVAAGNEGRPADLSSPASEPSVCTVGATAINDTLIEWSNYGPIVDILAPGVDITSTYLGGTIETHSGTSMATPHIVGLAAYFMGQGWPVEGLCESMAGVATKGAIDESTLHDNTPNFLAFNMAEASDQYGKRTVRVA
ncbi:oryzin precursor [Alternaria rosae]|uniref:oryzin precursor n=1 Tax=Alternaria rosae TaxID=1187941 RepID=UPI001E8D9377|nr:oryzin precursor [Alternaria rosae]KAH6881404.1 oryzin precursor [Alternaria rosae]